MMTVDLTLPYDDSNVFARILRGELPCGQVYEDDHALAFHDLHPAAPVHVLVIPRGRFVSFIDFVAGAPPASVSGFWRAVSHTAATLGLERDGYRLLANTGAHAHQMVAHFHVHILGGRPLGPLLAPLRESGNAD